MKVHRNDSLPKFPSTFEFGAATSAYQVEGGWDQGGKGVSVWDTFAHEGKIVRGETGDVACDHFHRWREDVQLIRELKIPAYRFSISWSRIFPCADMSAPNKEGLAFYRALVTELVASGIVPVVTLYHWDHPQWLEERGGWLNRKSVDEYVRFCRAVYTELGDDVGRWITLNEPRVVVERGYGSSSMAPGRNDPSSAMVACHHLLLAHGRAVQEYRDAGLKGEIGITLNLKVAHPRSEVVIDQRAATEMNLRKNLWYLQPVLTGTYPIVDSEFADEFRREVPWQHGDREVLATPIDFLGVNYYSRSIVSAEPATDGFSIATHPAAGPVSSLGWEIYPRGLLEILRTIQELEPTLPILITENGIALTEEGGKDPIQDQLRVQFLRDHLFVIQEAIHEGIKVQGYYAWSLLDNLEWGFGYAPKFGLVHVDHTTQVRTPKLSAEFFSEVITSNAKS